MSDSIDQVVASYHRCRDDRHFFDTFYDLFLAKSPDVADRFAQTDFNVQKRMLRESLLQVLCLDRGISGVREEILQLGQRHQELNITPEMYVMWLDALCEAVAVHDPQSSNQLQAEWRRAVQPAIDLMLGKRGT
jgi:hemoglobin-like flavoprotein